MPPSKIKPADMAVEAKKIYIPYIKQKYADVWPAMSWLVSDTSALRSSPQSTMRCRIAVVEGDPVDVAIDLAKTINKIEEVALVNMANEKRPGGDWEANVMAPEECLCRRSNLFATLSTPDPSEKNLAPINYPIPSKGGIYSEKVVIFRAGPDHYQLWQTFKALPVISVAPVRRPKLDSAGKKYSFEQEKELMKEKIRTVLRIALWYGHTDLCLGPFGCGAIFRNPTREVARMWRDALYFEDEFKGRISNVVFAFDITDGSYSTKSSGSNKSSSSKGAPKSSALQSEMDIWKDVFDPKKIFKRD